MTEPWVEVAMYGGAVVAGSTLFLLKQVRESVTKWLKKVRGGHSNFPEVKVFEMDRNIHDMLVELRVEVNADRACLYQFHNGQVFSSQNPVWRVSCTHESCSVGTSHEMGRGQSMLSSSLIDLLTPLFTKLPQKGISTMSVDDITLFVFDTKEMPDSYWRTLLVSSGAESVLVSPMLDKGQIVGFLTLCFLDRSTVMNAINNSTIRDMSSKILLEMKGCR
jgi:hypothetical protein